MTKENIILQTEMVYELKNEIPSYEEFLKNYQVDQKISDNYKSEIESYSNIESSPIYGPMPRARASASTRERKLPSYYNFLCKCEAKFNSFPEFLNHIEDFHEIKNFNFPQILGQRNGSRWDIKFYWGLSCQCGHKFSSSLCNASLKVSNKQIELLRKYRLQCLKCKNYANFDREELLNKFLEERVKQKLIYSYYKRKFEQYTRERDGEKKLEGHRRELCEKCKLLGRYCGDN